MRTGWSWAAHDREVSAERITVAVVQAEVGPDLTSPLELTSEGVHAARAAGAQLVVFPETWIPGYPAWLDVCRNAALWVHARDALQQPAHPRARRATAQPSARVGDRKHLHFREDSLNNCVFCRIAEQQVPAVVLYEDADIMAFLDSTPIRRGHTQIIPKSHVATFELLPPALASKIMMLGQQLARQMKAVYKVERIAFLFTGGDVAHTHAHVVPMHDKTDITSARYLVQPPEPVWSSSQLQTDRASLLRVSEELAFVPTPSE